MKKNKQPGKKLSDAFVFTHFVESASDAVDGYSARADELRVSGLSADQVRVEIGKEILASFIWCTENYEEGGVSGLQALIQIAAESICRSNPQTKESK